MYKEKLFLNFQKYWKKRRFLGLKTIYFFQRFILTLYMTYMFLKLYDEDEDANVEMILQGDSKQQGIHSSLQPDSKRTPIWHFLITNMGL